MNKIIPKIINISIFMALCFQAFIYYYNTKPSNKVFTQKSISVENFSSIVLSKSGITKIGSEKLNKIDDNNIYLQGSSYLENKEYKIYGSDISIDMKEEISLSDQSVEVVNSMGTLRAQGFKNFDSKGKIIFEGEVTFKSHE
jgi:GTP-dependent phosphoenolpyruvate carboxykinase